MSYSEVSHGFAVLNMTLDEYRHETRPIGVVAWDKDREWYGVRVIARGEKASNINPSRRMLIEAVNEQIGEWASESRVPYGREKVPAWTNAFWNDVKRVLTTCIQLEAPKAMERMQNPSEEMEFLFEALVKPTSGPSERTARIDGSITKVLGKLSNKLEARASLMAFGNIHETVLRAAQGSHGRVIVEGVNLSGESARRDADALVSKLMRVLEAPEKTEVVIGYNSSPGGLNGESHMRDWMIMKVSSNVFSLQTESDQFRDRTRKALVDVGVLNDSLPDI